MKREQSYGKGKVRYRKWSRHSGRCTKVDREHGGGGGWHKSRESVCGRKVSTGEIQEARSNCSSTATHGPPSDA